MNTPHRVLVRKLKEHSQALALPLGRKVGAPGLDVARDYLLREMAKLHLKPFHGDSFEICYERPHPNGGHLQKFTNLVGVIRGKNRALPPILLGAHYDSVIDAPCVDDNATSVALNLVIADQYCLHNFERDLIIAFFDAEEPPHFLGPTMGSRRFCEDYCGEIRFSAVIVSDLIGHDQEIPGGFLPPFADALVPQVRELVFLMGSESDAKFPAIIEEVAGQSSGIRIFPTLHRYVGPVSDHQAFAKQGQPFLFLSCGQGRYYHDPRDDMDWINFDKLAHITRFVGDVIERIDQAPDTDRDQDPTDPFEYEIRMMKRAVGTLPQLAAKAYGFKIPQSREDLDTFISGIINGNVPKTR